MFFPGDSVVGNNIVCNMQIWQKVKAANRNFTVCEIGATIGRLWREMTDTDKQRYNDDFAHDKVILFTTTL